MSTQTSYPRQAVKRTLASLLAALPFAVGALVALSEIIKVINESFGAHLPDSFQNSSVAIAAIAIAIATALTRIMAIPAINILLTKIGLGAEPKKAVKEMEEILETQTEPYNIPTVDEITIEEKVVSSTEVVSPLTDTALQGRG